MVFFLFFFGGVSNCITMLLCGICNITLLSCKFGNHMVQHNDGLIHKELLNAWSCMTDDKFCVFLKRSKTKKGDEIWKKGGPTKGKENN
jgi:hypothetical protein